MGDDDIMYKTLHNFYDKNKINDLLCVLNRKNNDISLRLIDWFATNYAKKHNTRITHPELSTSFNVYIEYKNQLKAFSKKKFDPFCRRDRILFKKYGKEINTTIGQLNFFRWAFQNGIVKYVRKNTNIIEKDMLNSLSKSQNLRNQKKKNSFNKRRSELSMCASKSFTCVNLPCLIQLD